MAINCTTSELAGASKCFTSISPQQQGAIQIYLLCAILNGETVNTNPNILAQQSACFTSLSPAVQQAFIIYLLCQVANGGGGGNGAQLVPYTVAPPPNPADITKPALAYDPTGNLPTYGWNTGTQTWN